jgi:hypothetical protein
VAIGAAGVVSVLKAPPAPPPLPSPNGYDDLVAAGQAVFLQAPGWVDPAAMPIEDLRKAVEANRSAFDRARVGLSRRCQVPVTYEQTDHGRRMGEISRIRALGRLMVLAEKLAEREDRFDEAARIGLDLVRLGHAMARGGLLVDEMGGLAVESIGLQALQGQSDRIPIDRCRGLIRELEELDRTREPLSAVDARDRDWGYYSAGAGQRVSMRLVAARLEALRQPAVKATEAARKKQVARLRALEVGLAARLYREEHGAPPKDFAALVPRYLDALPADPYDSGVLYSESLLTGETPKGEPVPGDEVRPADPPEPKRPR